MLGFRTLKGGFSIVVRLRGSEVDIAIDLAEWAFMTYRDGADIGASFGPFHFARTGA